VAVTDLAGDAFTVLHSLAIRGTVSYLPEGSDALVQGGLVRSTSAGYELTALGHGRHRALLEIERRALDLELLEMTYERLLALTRRLRDILIELEVGSEAARRRLVVRLCSVVDAAEPILGRSVRSRRGSRAISRGWRPPGTGCSTTSWGTRVARTSSPSSPFGGR
jgi:hypothetical protein